MSFVVKIENYISIILTEKLILYIMVAEANTKPHTSHRGTYKRYHATLVLRESKDKWRHFPFEIYLVSYP